MKIEITNEISSDGQLEKIKEVRDCQVYEKGDFSYLLYYNDENEKVIIKSNQSQMMMTRFSRPKTIMTFITGQPQSFVIPTPLGLQQFQIDTHDYDFNLNDRTITLNYCLLQADGKETFATYRLDIKWYTDEQ